MKKKALLMAIIIPVTIPIQLEAAQIKFSNETTPGVTHQAGIETINRSGQPIGVKAQLDGDGALRSIESVTVSEIEHKYVRLFEQLEQEANTAVDRVVDQAIKDIKEAKATSLFNLEDKYSEKGTKIEAEYDMKFNRVYNEFIIELKNNGFDSGIALEYKKTYEKAKQARKKELLLEILKELF